MKLELLGDQKPQTATPPGWVHHTQGCAACQISVHFRLCRGMPGFPDFVKPVWPDECWIGWSWSRDTPGKLELQVLCSQTCLTDWFETAQVAEAPTEPAQEGHVHVE